MSPRSHASHRYVAFLRAINVGGHIVKMDRLRAEFESLGFQDVTTLIASGNVIFSSASPGPAVLERRIEERLALSLGYAVATFLRTPEQLAAIVAGDPFADRSESCTLYVGFLKGTLSPQQRTGVLACRTEVDELAVGEREVFWLCRTRSSDSKVSGARMEKVLAAPATFRNITTVRKLAALTTPS